MAHLPARRPATRRHGERLLGSSIRVEREQVIVRPRACALNRLVELKKGRGAVQQEAPEDARLDVSQGYLELEVGVVVGHGLKVNPIVCLV